jgi:transposase
MELITVQNKAWNDAFGMRMHIDIQLTPFKALHSPDKPLLLVMDNCAIHNTKEVIAAIDQSGWILKFLPPNMTAKMQPMDLVVNAVVKAALRRVRVSATLDYFKEWKQKRLEDSYDNQDLLNFDPPKPNITIGISTMLELMSTTFKGESFRAALKRTFTLVSLIKDESTNTFRSYTEKFLGNLKFEKFP